MITFDRYEAFLADLSNNGIASSRVDAIVETADRSSLFVLKHDVEADLPIALKLAQLEEAYGHRATYYFQGNLLSEDKAHSIVRQIVDLGHEAALHYDVLDAHDGDYEKATEEFDHHISRLQDFTGSAVTSVCPHGNPTKIRNGWRSNKDFFKASRIRERYKGTIDIVVDFPQLLPRGLYISDAGFKLRKIANIAGNDSSTQSAMDDGFEIAWSDVVELGRQHEGIVFSIHPHRLRESQIQVLMMRGRMKVLRTGYRLTRSIPGVRQLASRYYAISRKL